MFAVDRRGLIAGLASALASPKAASPDPRSRPYVYTSVRAFGAKGDGVTDDTRAIRAAIAAAPLGGTVWFPPGTYIVRRTIALRPGTTYQGSNPQSSVIKQADGANLVAVLADENFLLNRPGSALGIQIEDLGIDGNSSRNRRGHGIVLMTERCLVRHVFVSFPPQAGIVLSDKNHRGAVIHSNAVENRIEGCTVIQPGTYGIWILDTHSSGKVTDGYLLNNVVQDSQGAWAMRIERAAGWFIANNHVYHCAGSGIYLSHVAGTYFYCNEVDKFGYTKSPPNSYYGVQAAFFMGRFRASVFLGNLCATAEGLYPRNLYTYYDLGGDQYGQSNVVLIGNVAHNDPIGSPPKAVHAYESTAFTYTTQRGGRLDVTKAANINGGARTYEYVPQNANVQLGAAAPETHTPVTTALAAGAVGGAVVGGVGLAARSRQGREQLAKLAGSNPPPAPGAGTQQGASISVIETLSRWEIDPLGFPLETGSIHLTYFVPLQQAEVTQIVSATGDRSASGAALCRAGVYEVLETGGLKLIGATGNGAGRFWVIPQSVTAVDLDPKFGPLPLTLTAGRLYAYAEIQVGGSSATRVGKAGNPSLMALEPRASAKYPGFGDLPASLPPPSDENASGLQLYARLTRGNLAERDSAAKPAWVAPGA